MAEAKGYTYGGISVTDGQIARWREEFKREVVRLGGSEEEAQELCHFSDANIAYYISCPVSAESVAYTYLYYGT